MNYFTIELYGRYKNAEWLRIIDNYYIPNIDLPCIVLNTSHGLCPLFPHLSSDKFLPKCHFLREVFFGLLTSTRPPCCGLIISYPLPSWLLLSVLDSLLIGWNIPWGKWNWLFLLWLPLQDTGHILKNHYAAKKKKNWKLVLIFPESFKITRNFPLIIHNKVSKNLLSNFSSLLHSISHWQHSCHQKLSFSPNFVKLPLKAHFCCTFPLSPSSLTLQSSQVPNLGSFQFIGSSDFSNSSQQSFRGRGEKDSRGHR